MTCVEKRHGVAGAEFVTCARPGGTTAVGCDEWFLLRGILSAFGCLAADTFEGGDR